MPAEAEMQGGYNGEQKGRPRRFMPMAKEPITPPKPQPAEPSAPPVKDPQPYKDPGEPPPGDPQEDRPLTDPVQPEQDVPRA